MDSEWDYFKDGIYWKVDAGQSPRAVGDDWNYYDECDEDGTYWLIDEEGTYWQVGGFCKHWIICRDGKMRHLPFQYYDDDDKRNVHLEP